MQRRGGFGKKGMKTREEDQVSELFTASTHSHLLIFTTKGQVFKVPVYTIRNLADGTRDADRQPRQLGR